MKTVVALYNRFEDAQAAVRALRDAGFNADSINMIANDQNGKYAKYLQGDTTKAQEVDTDTAAGAGVGAVIGGLGGLLVGLGALAIPGIGPVIAAGPIVATLTGIGVGAVAGGIVGALVGLGIPEENAKVYAEGIRQGGTLVTVQTDDERAREAESILNQFNPVDINRRNQNQNFVNQPNNQNAVPVTGSDRNFDHDTDVDNNMNRETDVKDNIPVTGAQEGMDIPVIEEDMVVGKREVDRGGVRVNTDVTEEPVEKDVNLRQEHVNVERHPVDRPATDEDLQAFKEGTFEIDEKGEEPVVEKRARVVEEVEVNKDVDEENRTIKDTLHKTNVNVERVNPGMNDFEQNFRSHYQNTFANRGHDYQYYQTGYQFGYNLGQNNQYANYDWNRLEPIARRNWESQGYQTPWNDVKDAVQYGWETFSSGNNTNRGF